MTSFEFTSKQLNQDNQNVNEEAGSAAAANIHVHSIVWVAYYL